VDPTHVYSVAECSKLTVVEVAVVDIEKSSAARNKERSQWDNNSLKNSANNSVNTLLYMS
jgi:hypothetical protein